MKISDGECLSELEIRCLLLAAEKILNELGIYHSACEWTWLELRDWLAQSNRKQLAGQVAKKYLVLLAKEI